MSAMNAGVAARSRVVDGADERVFEGMVAAMLAALWDGRRPEDVDLAGIGFTPGQIARHFTAAEREAKWRHAVARSS